MIFLSVFLSLILSIDSLTVKGELNTNNEKSNEYSLNLENLRIFKTLANPSINIKGQICNFTSFMNMYTSNEDLNLNNWILLVNNATEYQDTINLLKKENQKILKSVIFLQKIVKFSDDNIAFFLPIFSIKYNDYIQLQNQTKAYKNSILEIKYEIILSSFFGYSLSIFSLLNFFFIILFSYYYNKQVFTIFRYHSNQVNKAINYLPKLRASISFVIIYYIYNNIFGVAFLNQFFIELVYDFFNSLYVSMISILIYLISKGWGVYFQDFMQKYSVSGIFAWFIVILLYSISSPFIDITMTHKIFYFYISDFKDFFLVLVVSSYVVCKISKIFNKIIVSMDLILKYNSNCVEAVKLKLSMLRFIKYLVIIYAILYITMITVFRIVFPLEDNVLLVFALKILGDIAMIIFLYVYRPREFPQFFNDSLNFHSAINIYTVNLGNEFSVLNKKSSSSILTFFEEKKENDLIIILNPEYKNENHFNENIIDKLKIGQLVV